MQVRIIKVGYLQTNCYILIQGNKCIVIDPGDDFYSIESQIGNNELIGIFLTHRHPDHIGALDEMLGNYDVPVYDINNLEEKKYDIDGFKFEVIYTKGHTSDSISLFFYQYNFMFTGDFLFKGTIGRTDLPTGDMNEMKKSIEKIKAYHGGIKIYPGHGEESNLGYEKDNNPFFD